MDKFRYFIVFLFLLVLSSCGQVGTITGGDKDVTSPRVVMDEVQPPKGSTQINPQEIIIPFDEFIAFNSPSKNIVVSPNDVQLNHTIRGKSVVLTVDKGEWKPNTTYSIFLNHAVKDITEGNDSIISYVFSTGSYIDSMQAKIQVIDAYTLLPANEITVGLYNRPLETDTSSVSPRYFSSTDKNGVATFQFIKDTLFYAYAFEDINRNNMLDPQEKRAALNQPIFLSDSVDSLLPSILLMPPVDSSLHIFSNEVLPIASWAIGFNRPLKSNEKIKFSSPSPYSLHWNSTKDSVTAYYSTTEKSGTLQALVYIKDSIDTLTKKYFFKSLPEFEVTTNITNSTLPVLDTLTLFSNEVVDGIDTIGVQLSAVTVGDSISRAIQFTLDSISPVGRQLIFNKVLTDKYTLTLLPGSIKGLNQTFNDTLKFSFRPEQPDETGTMLIEFDTIPPYGYLFIENTSSKKTQKIHFNGDQDSTYRIPYLPPGKYQFHYLIDTNKDGVWTTGSVFDSLQPERMIWFPIVSQIRANWEVKTTLSIKEKLTKE